MTLHFHWLHAPHWLAHASVNRAMTLVLGIIGVSLLFGALRVLDVAVSAAPVPMHAGVVAPAPATILVGTDPAREDSAPVDADLVEVPDATAEAISL